MLRKGCFKRAVSLFMCSLFVLNFFSFEGFAEGNSTSQGGGATSGTCGDNLTWTLTEDGTLTISGTGDMDNYIDFYYGSVTQPWQQFRDSVKSVIVEEGVTSIGNYAFYSCNSLTSAQLPESLLRIGGYAFNSTDLKAVTIPLQITSGSNDMYNAETGVLPYAFSGNPNLTVVRFLAPIISIPEGAFCGCNNITDVYYPGTTALTGAIQFSMWNGSLGTAVWHCSNGELDGVGPLSGKCGTSIAWQLESDGTLTIAGTGFMDDYSLASGAPWESRKNMITKLIIENGVYNVGYYAFDGAELLSEVSLPESLRYIGDFSFSGCGSLQKMYSHSATLEVLPFEGNPFPMPFSRCEAFTDLFFWGTEEDAESIRDYLPTSVVWHYIGSDTLSLPATLTTIEAEAFSGTKAQKIVIPDSVEYIQSHAFAGSEFLQTIWFEGSPRSIADDILSGCGTVIIDCLRGSSVEDWANGLDLHVEYHH